MVVRAVMLVGKVVQMSSGKRILPIIRGAGETVGFEFALGVLST
jgi:hypothetical protein